MSAAEPILLITASGLAREAADAARAAGFDPVGYLDDNSDLHGTVRTGARVLGPLEQVADSDLRLVIAAGPGSARLRIAQRLLQLGVGQQRYATLVHPSVQVPGSCTVGHGSILLAGVVLTADVRLGAHVVAMPHAVLTHDDVLADGVTLCASATVAGSVQIGAGAYLGAGCLIRENLTIGADAVIGQGSVVLHDVPAGQTWVGNPARCLRTGKAPLSDSRTEPPSTRASAHS